MHAARQTKSVVRSPAARPRRSLSIPSTPPAKAANPIRNSISCVIPADSSARRSIAAKMNPISFTRKATYTVLDRWESKVESEKPSFFNP